MVEGLTKNIGIWRTDTDTDSLLESSTVFFFFFFLCAPNCVSLFSFFLLKLKSKLILLITDRTAYSTMSDKRRTCKFSHGYKTHTVPFREEFHYFNFQIVYRKITKAVIRLKNDNKI